MKICSVILFFVAALSYGAETLTTSYPYAATATSFLTMTTFGGNDGSALRSRMSNGVLPISAAVTNNSGVTVANYTLEIESGTSSELFGHTNVLGTYTIASAPDGETRGFGTIPATSRLYVVGDPGAGYATPAGSTELRFTLTLTGDGRTIGTREFVITATKSTNGNFSNSLRAEFTDSGQNEGGENEVAYDFTIGNDSKTIFLCQILEEVDGDQLVRASFASQPGDHTYEGTFLCFDETVCSVSIVTFVDGIGPDYVFVDRSGVPWVAFWQIDADHVPTLETGVGFFTVGDHDGVLTITDQATGAVLEVIELGNGAASFSKSYGGSEDVVLTLGGSTGSITQMPDGSYVINPTADGPPTKQESQLGSYVDSNGVLHKLKDSTVTSGGIDHSFGPDGENYSGDDKALERIDIGTTGAMAKYSPGADGELVDSAVQEGALKLEEKYQDGEGELDGNADGHFDLIPVPENWYAGLGTATEWRVSMPRLAVSGIQIPDVVVDLSKPVYGVIRSIIAVAFGVMLTLAAYKFARI